MRLIHLNGPPGIGKSTIAALLADRHPGTLDLDIDTLHRLVGGWREDTRTHDLLRPVALAMAAAHLQGGHDVVLPQLVSRLDEIAAFEDVARRHGATFHEVVLLDTREASVARFDAREDRTEWDAHNRRTVADLGGARLLGQMYDGLLEVARARPSAVVVRSEAGSVEGTYARVVDALAQPGRRNGGSSEASESSDS